MILAVGGIEYGQQLKGKSAEFKAKGFTVKEQEKSIHDKESVRFATEVIVVSGWERRILEDVLRLDFESMPGK